jgi:hydroxyacylglutathione hydrolase
MEIHSWAVGPLETNCYLLTSEAAGVLIDPGWELPELATALGERKLKYIIVTHVHLDHVYGLHSSPLMKGAQVCLPRADTIFLDSLANQAQQLGFPPPPMIKAERELAAGDELEFGAERLQVLETPGHTPGHICLVSSAGVFVGDVLFAGSVGRTDLPMGNEEQLMRSIKEQLLVMPDETIVYSGHGPNTTIGEEKRSNPFLK